ncbi:hypothetical protein [Yoonia sp. 208BN28-4]|uniref:hypothetical protein n=1 Tax=Yoonia sp. 208BN28-4 TaxID=3126505 RepID=UPI0030B487A7
MHRLIIAAMAALPLAACMGGETATGDLRPTFDDRLAESDATIADMRALFARENQATFGQTPRSASVIYTGLAVGRISDVADAEANFKMIADMNADVNFIANSATGELTNFQHENNTYLDGQMTMTSTGLRNSGTSEELFGLTLNLSGSVSYADVDYVLDAPGTVDLTGTGSDYFAGEFEGSVLVDDTVVGTADLYFSLERQ